MTKTYLITDKKIDTEILPSSANPVSGSAVYAALAEKQQLVRTLQVVLDSGGWTENVQTVAAEGITADSILLVSPAPVSHVDYCKADIYCSAQGNGSITFVCGSNPAENVTVNVMVL